MSGSRFATAAAIAIVLALTTPARAEAADGLRATLERDRVHLEETVRLVLETDSASSSPGPDLSGLERDFEVLGNSASTELRFENGRQSARTRWLIELAPKRPGAITIPSLAVGRQRSEALTLTVLEPRSDEPRQREIFLEAQAEPANPYVNAQVLYTLRVYRAVEILEAKLSDPEVPGAVVRRLGKNVNYTASIGGQRFRVLERRYAIFPQTSGTLRIPAARLSGQVVSRRGGSNLSRLFGAGRPIRAVADAIELEVRTKPPAAGPGPWLPARALNLRESWSTDPPRFKVGEPITWTLRMEANGLEGAALPALDPPGTEGVRLYADQPLVESRAGKQSVHGLREHRIALVPTTAGEFVLPEIVVRWWDVGNDALREATIPARRIRVAQADASADAPTPLAPSAVAGPPVETAASNNPWAATAAGLFVLWLVTAGGWYRSARRRLPPDDAPPAPSRAGALRRDLIAACSRNDAAAVRPLLLAYAAARSPRRAPTGLRDVPACIGDPSMAALLEPLDQALYAPAPAAWNGAALADRIRGLGKKPADGATGATDAPLPPLHPG